LQSDPNNEELQALAAELEEAISSIEALIEELQPSTAPKAPEKPPPPTEKPKWSKENHPAYQAGYKKPDTTAAPAEEAKPHVYKVNDTVLAKWVTGDKGFYPARITSITGSSADPVYYVTFKSYDNTETLRSGDIKPIYNDSKKRKADGSPVSTVSSTPVNPNVISAAANIDQSLANAAKQDSSKVGDGPAKPAKIAKKIKAKKELEAGKSKWQDFTAKTKGSKLMKGKKDSMFRTGDSVTARGKLEPRYYSQLVTILTDS
jgi:survival-of-motor-neuron-related-splicing factor 30